MQTRLNNSQHRLHTLQDALMRANVPQIHILTPAIPPLCIGALTVELGGSTSGGDEITWIPHQLVGHQAAGTTPPATSWIPRHQTSWSQLILSHTFHLHTQVRGEETETRHLWPAEWFLSQGGREDASVMLHLWQRLRHQVHLHPHPQLHQEVGGRPEEAAKGAGLIKDHLTTVSKSFFLATATTNCASRLGQGDLRGAEGRWPQQVQCPGAN